MILEIATVILGVALAVVSVLLYVASKKLLMFDDLFNYMVDDLDINFAYLDKLIKTPLYENTPEVVAAHKNMEIIHARMDEILLRVQETTGKKIIRRTFKNPNAT